MKAVAVLFVLALAGAIAIDDPCSVNPTCTTCLDHPFCGWCSQAVVYDDGTLGTQCAGFDLNAGNKPFQCQGTYQTTECLAVNSYGCSNTTYQCVIVGNGNGQTLDECTATCVAPTYECNTVTGTCDVVPPGFGTSLPICQASCQQVTSSATSASAATASAATASAATASAATSSSTSSTTTSSSSSTGTNDNYLCDKQSLQCIHVAEGQGTAKAVCELECGKPNNSTPASLNGVWRGIQISEAFQAGEWDVKFENNSVTVRDGAGDIWLTGTVATMEDELWVYVLTPLSSKGLIVRSLWQIADSAEVRLLTWAPGLPGANPPVDYDQAMINPDAKVFMLTRCASDATCAFSWPASTPLSTRRSMNFLEKRVDDSCSVFPNCTSCIGAHQSCGWCSAPVIYDDGTTGKQCAGFNPDSTKRPFVCYGIYSTESCIPDPPSAAQTYSCDLATNSCIAATAGTGTSYAVCNTTCGQPVVPSNTTPAVLDQVVWRGIQINSGYVNGEWVAVFNDSKVTLVTPSGTMTADTTEAGSELWLHFTSGPLTGYYIKTLYEVTYAIETKVMAWAWGIRGDSTDDTVTPAGFDQAMITTGEAEVVMFACNSASVCDFSSVVPKL